MGKHFLNFKVSKLISSFKSCRSKHPSSLPSNPVPSSFLHPSNHLSHKPLHFSLKRHVSSALLSARRSFSRPRSSHDSSHTQSSPSSSSSSRFRWVKHPKYHVMAIIPIQNYDSTPPRRKIYNSAASDDNSSHNDVVLHQKRRRISRRRRTKFRNFRISTSSDSGLFSDGGDDTETLVSTDSSVLPPRCRRRAVRKSNAPPSPARLSEFMRKMIPCTAEDEVVEGKVRDSFAVVKRSEDPYEDFRRSMAEMVVEKQIFERKDMEELLRCFLSLNSEHLHGVIVRAFVDIWDALFGGKTVPT